jgi:hypothetical protein
MASSRISGPRLWPGLRNAAGVLRAAACGLAALWLLANGGEAPPPGPNLHLTRDQLVRNFDTIVFHNEFDSQTDKRLRKWAVPVRLFLDIRAGDRKLIEFAVQQHVRHLAEITGYDVALTDDPAAANVTVVFERESALDQIRLDYFPPSFDIKPVMQTNLCIGQYQSNSRYEIVHGIVVIPTDRVMSRGRLEACIVEEITQILGLPNDSDDVFPSIFNDRSIDIELTAQDILLIKLLFDPRLRAGMPRADALANVRMILGEMGYGGERTGEN